MRRVGAAIAVLALGAPHAVASPFPATLVMRAGMFESSHLAAPPWGTPVPASQDRWIEDRSTASAVAWGVWRRGGYPPLLPVRTTDSGRGWTVAGPALASDFVGGGIYYVTRTISEGRTAVVMVSGAVIDVSTDAGHHWYQYLNPDDNWSITRASVAGGGIAIRIGPARYASLPQSDYAIYRLDVARHRWVRATESLSVTSTSG